MRAIKGEYIQAWLAVKENIGGIGMKRVYETPSAEKIAFDYRDQVVAASGDGQSGSTQDRLQELLDSLLSGDWEKFVQLLKELFG